MGIKILTLVLVLILIVWAIVYVKNDWNSHRSRLDVIATKVTK